MKHLQIKIMGAVQGVFFRASVQREAKRLGLVGFVRNDHDGSVYVEAEGNELALEQFLSWCRKGPPAANVENLELEYKEAFKDFTNFDIHQ